MKPNFNKSEKRAIKEFLQYYESYLKANDYKLSTDFSDSLLSESDIDNCHIGMQFMVEQMLHELKSMKTAKQKRKEEESRLRRLEILNQQ